MNTTPPDSGPPKLALTLVLIVVLGLIGWGISRLFSSKVSDANPSTNTLSLGADEARPLKEINWVNGQFFLTVTISNKPPIKFAELGFRSDGTVMWRPVQIPPQPKGTNDPQ